MNHTRHDAQRKWHDPLKACRPLWWTPTPANQTFGKHLTLTGTRRGGCASGSAQRSMGRGGTATFGFCFLQRGGSPLLGCSTGGGSMAETCRPAGASLSKPSNPRTHSAPNHCSYFFLNGAFHRFGPLLDIEQGPLAPTERSCLVKTTTSTAIVVALAFPHRHRRKSFRRSRFLGNFRGALRKRAETFQDDLTCLVTATAPAAQHA
mmetsp:Transcript_55278/g.140185  ORF Transcript_55278/g.140185 Transcript_55278/m.140185 type:complete len:206 (-) Transcript_55278:665-1282(-)